MITLFILLTALALFTTAIDWAQTIVIAQNPQTWSENNPLLGRHPSERRVHVYFACCCVIIFAGAIGLLEHAGPGWASLAMLAVALFEAYWVRHNWRNGIQV